jgi:hypothetical protein
VEPGFVSWESDVVSPFQYWPLLHWLHVCREDVPALHEVAAGTGDSWNPILHANEHEAPSARTVPQEPIAPFAGALSGQVRPATDSEQEGSRRRMEQQESSSRLPDEIGCGLLADISARGSLFNNASRKEANRERLYHGHSKTTCSNHEAAFFRSSSRFDLLSSDPSAQGSTPKLPPARGHDEGQSVLVGFAARSCTVSAVRHGLAEF